MKLVIQIPCLDEEATLARTLADLPRDLPGIDEIEVLIIDDGCKDATVRVATEAGVKSFVRFPVTVGLARAFRAGLDRALELGADIVVNTDADNQYVGADIGRLVEPILNGQAEIVIGARDIDANPEFSNLKKWLQHFGTSVVCRVARVDVPDATTGFRAFTRQAAMQLNVHSEFSYTLETLIQAGWRRIPVAWVPIRTNRKTRESRLFQNIPSYLKRSGGTIVRIAAMYEPLKIFFYIGSAIFAVGSLLVLRFLYYYWLLVNYSGHVQSLVLAGVLLVIGFQTMMLGLVADLIAANRRLLDELLFRIRRQELDR